MSVTRSLDNANKLIDWTEEVNEIENQYGFIRSQGIFETKGTSQTAIVFDKNTHDITLLPQASRKDRKPTTGKDRKLETFSLPLSYFKHQDSITPEDIQGIRQPNTPDGAESLARVKAEKLTDMRLAVDQTKEYMQLQAMKGIFKTPDGAVLADMFSEFGVTQKQVDFELGNNATDIDKKIREVKSHISKNIKSGGAISGVDFYVDVEFFDKLIQHPKLREVYNMYINNGSQRNRDDLTTYMTWGITDTFEHRGVRFISYDAEFTLPDDSTELAFELSEGLAVPRGARGLFRGYHGPSNKLSGANVTGAEMYAYEYVDPRDEFMDMEVEFSDLYFCTKPQVLVKAISSN